MTYKLLSAVQEMLFELYLNKEGKYNQEFRNAANDARNAILNLMKFF